MEAGNLSVGTRYGILPVPWLSRLPKGSPRHCHEGLQAQYHDHAVRVSLCLCTSLEGCLLFPTWQHPAGPLGTEMNSQQVTFFLAHEMPHVECSQVFTSSERFDCLQEGPLAVHYR